MRWYAIDDLSADETAKVRSALRDMRLGSGMDGLYWLPVPRELLSPLQAEHEESCGPHVMALEVEENFLRLEMLVRARARLRCHCVRYAEAALRERMIAWLEQLLADLDIAA